MEEIEQPKYTVIDLAAAQASMLDEEPVCPDCLALPNKPRQSLDGSLGICTGTGFQFELYTLTQSEAEALMQTPEWSSPEEV